jgi:GT2 family glycosyltransferase
VISIIIPTYRRPQQLTRCLEAIACLEYPRDEFEVIVVDDGGQTQLDHVVRSFTDRRVAVSLLRQPHAGPAAARNAGTERARGRYVAFLDDDCAPDPGWLRELVTCLTTHADAAIGGRTLNALPDNLYSSATQLLVDYVSDQHNGGFRHAAFFPSNNLAVSKSSFQAIGGFNVRFEFPGAEDRDLCDRWLRHGFRLHYAPEAIVHHAHFLTLGSFWSQHVSYGRGAYSFWHANRRRGAGFDRRRIAFLLRLPIAPFRMSKRRRPLWLAAALIVSQAATVSGVLLESMRSRRPEESALRVSR